MLEERIYLSTRFFEAAESFATNANRLESSLPGLDNAAAKSEAYSHYQSFSLGAILFSAAYIEAKVNELLADLADSPDRVGSKLSPEAARVLAAIWRGRLRLPTLRKYVLVLDLAGAEPIETALYQDAKALFQLRNALAHFTPEWRAIDEEEPDDPDKIERTLKCRFQLNPFRTASEAVFLDRCIGAGCASWALTTATEFVKQLCVKVGLDPDRLRESSTRLRE